MDVMRLTGIRPERRGGGSTYDGPDSSSVSSGLRKPYASGADRRNEVSVDIVAYCDLHQAGVSADITQTVDYEQLAHRAASVIESEGNGLLEALAYAVAQSVLLSHRISLVEVTAHRARCIRGVHVDDVSVTIQCGSSREDSLKHVDDAQSSEDVNGMTGHSPAQTRQSTEECPTVPMLKSTLKSALEPHVEHTVESASGLTAGSAAAASSHRSTDSDSAVGRDGRSVHTRQAVIALQTPVAPNGADEAQHALRMAVVGIDSVPGNQVLGISPLYRCIAVTQMDSFHAVVMVETTLDDAGIHSSLALLQSSHLRGGRSAGDVSQTRHGIRATLLDLRSRNHGVGSDASSPSGDFAENVGLSEHAESSEHAGFAEHAEILAPWNDLNASIRRPDSIEIGTMLKDMLRDAPNRRNINKVSDTWILGGAV
ncbi:MAG: dihydroneopterin aldolase [Bifidobacterium sp.]|uniref:dihydroneopterin aldolase n=1 Tax=Bifidobacterium sp. TaxID=41200 RepID=UPI0039E7CD7A